MSDYQNGVSPSLTQATPSKPQGKKQNRTPAQGQPGQGKRNRNRQQNAAIPITQLDGTVSDSVTNASPRSKKAPRQRQSIAAGPHPAQNGQAGQVNGQKPRPVSVGGPMLPGGTPVKQEQAYAGPTFQASPAPNKLPMPKFLGSRSVPSAAHPAGLQARLAGEKTPPENESSPEADVVSPVQPRREAAVQSPLDMFFQADRMEKERKASAQLSPEAAYRRVPPGTEPRNSFHDGNRNTFLQGLHEDQPSPKTVPPDSRPNIERARSSPGVGGIASPPSSSKHDASTQALKNLLFNTAAESSTPPPQRPQSGDAANLTSGFETPSPFTRRSGPSTPTPNQQQNDYALHYGNRNLSPMFQAAKETPTRPSNLRQQLDQSQPAEPRQQLSPNAFSRSFLDQQIRSSIPSQPPSGLISNSDPSLVQHHQRGASQGTGFGPLNGQVNGAPQGSPRNSGPRDVKGMEDDLRRMLKLS